MQTIRNWINFFKNWVQIGLSKIHFKRLKLINISYLKFMAENNCQMHSWFAVQVLQTCSLHIAALMQTFVWITVFLSFWWSKWAHYYIVFHCRNSFSHILCSYHFVWTNFDNLRLAKSSVIITVKIQQTQKNEIYNRHLGSKWKGVEAADVYSFPYMRLNGRRNRLSFKRFDEPPWWFSSFLTEGDARTVPLTKWAGPST